MINCKNLEQDSGKSGFPDVPLVIEVTNGECRNYNDLWHWFDFSDFLRKEIGLIKE